MTVRWRGTHVFDRIIVGDLVGHGYQEDGEVYYVKKDTGKDTDSGTSWANAYKTILKALDVAGDYARIIVGLGVYDEGEVLNITQTGLKLLGIMTSGFMWGQPSLKGSSATHTLINVKANSVEIAGFGFTHNKARPIISIAEDAWGIHTWRTHIHHCFLGGNNVATYGVWSGGVGTEAVATIVELCEFTGCLVGVRQNGGLGMVRKNVLAVPAGGIGVEDVPNSTSRPTRWILDNKFATLAADAIGVKVTNTPSPGNLMIDENRFVGFADEAHACDVVTSGKTGLMGVNYLGRTLMAES